MTTTMFMKCKVPRQLTRQGRPIFSNNFGQIRTYTTSNDLLNFRSFKEPISEKFSFRNITSEQSSFRDSKFRDLQSPEPQTTTETKKFTLSTTKALERKNTVVIHKISNIYPAASVLESLKSKVELFKDIKIVKSFETEGHTSDHYSLNLVLENDENAPKEQCAWYIAKEFGKGNDHSFDGKTILVTTHKENLAYRQVFMPALPRDFTVEKLIKLDPAFKEAVAISLKDGKSLNKIATVEFKDELKAKNISKKDIILAEKPLKMVVTERITGKWNSSIPLFLL